MNGESRPATADAHGSAPISRVYSGSHEQCREAMERDAAELAPTGYQVISESYAVSWGAGVCVGCLSVEFGREAPDAPRAPDNNQ